MRRARTAWVIAALSAALAAPAAADHDFPHTLETAFARSPDLSVMEDALKATRARRSFSERLLPSAPEADASIRHDRLGANEGNQEYEFGVDTELWLPGQADANRHLAAMETRHLKAQAEVVKLGIAGRVRSLYWDVESARKAADLASIRLKAAQALVADVKRREQAGEVALADVLIAEAEGLEAENLLREQEATLASLLLDFEALTGGPPARVFEDRLSAPEGGLAQHPELIEVHLRSEVARAQVALSRANGRDRPRVGVFGFFERDEFGAPLDSSAGFRFSVPLGRNPEARIEEAEGAVQVSRALAQRRAMEIRLKTALRQARDAAAVAERQARLDGARLSTLARQAELIERAHKAGNAALADVIAARTLVFEADLAKAESETRLNRARSGVEQALGRLPKTERTSP